MMIQACCSAGGPAPGAPPPGVLHGIFAWWPMLWTVRAGLLILFVCLLYVFILNDLVGYLNPA